MIKVGDKLKIVKEEPGVHIKEGTLVEVVEVDKNAIDNPINYWDVKIECDLVLPHKIIRISRWGNSKNMEKVKQDGE